MRVTVALVGDPDTGLITEADWKRSWSDRPKVELDIEGTNSLAAILDRAFTEFGVPLPDYARSFSTAFPFTGFDDPGHGLRVGSSLDVVDDLGRVVWNVYDFDAIPFSQLRLSADAGTIRGSPERIYAVLQPPSGNGILVDWPTLLEGWRIAWEVMERLATVAEVAGGAELVRRIVQKLRRARQAVERNRSTWTQRGARPPDLTRTLLTGDWTIEGLARVLGCSDADALAVLEVFGFREADGVWSRGDDPDSTLLDGVREELDYAHHLRYEGFEPLLRERLEAFLQSGSRLSEEPYQAESPDEVLEVTSFGFADQIVTYHARLGERHVAGQVPLWELDESLTLTQLAYHVATRELRRLAAAAEEDAQTETA